MFKKKTNILALFLIMCSFLCGAGWFNKTQVVIDTESNRVYKYYMEDALVSDFTLNFKKAKEEHQGEYVLVSGVVKSVDENGKNIVLDNEKKEISVKCIFEKELRNSAKEFSKGDQITLFGQLDIVTIGKEIQLEVKRFSQTMTNAKTTDNYYLLDGSNYNKSEGREVSLAEGRVKFYVPMSWKEIEYNIKEYEEKDLGTIEGYQYVLNRIPGNASDVPESVFVCYFDNKLLADPNDADETELIEKAIVKNILGKVDNFPAKEVKTYYGSEYTYYSGVYKDNYETGVGYHTEFVFQADGEDGIVVILYVYKETNHISDVLFLTRFLEVNEK